MGVRASTSRKDVHARLRLDRKRAVTDLWSIWFDSNPSGGSFEVVLDDDAAIRIETKAAQVEAGYATLPAKAGRRRLRVRAVGDGEVRLFGAVIERSEAGVVLDELGIGGSGARRQLDWDEGLWAEHLRRRNPDLYVLAYGGLEAMRQDHDPARWEKELGEITARFGKAAPDASCLLISPQDLALRSDGEERERPAALDGVIAIQRRVAQKHGCAFFDTVAFMGGPGSMPKWVAAGLARDDHVHLSPKGYAHLGRVLADALLASYDRREVSSIP
jgi:lysophospholipase L1-like esterase